jgi:tetratricopeptide (TPR) repeat protein
MKVHFKVLLLSPLIVLLTNVWASDFTTKKSPSRAEVERLLGPLVLTSELSKDSVQLLMDEAESQYRSGRIGQAFEGFSAILEFAPRLSKAWLRIGNLRQRSGEEQEAIEAYQKAVTFAGFGGNERATRDKALLNISMLYLVRVSDALEILEQADQEQVSKSPEEQTEKEREDRLTLIELRQQTLDTETRASQQLSRMRPAAKQSKASSKVATP